MKKILLLFCFTTALTFITSEAAADEKPRLDLSDLVGVSGDIKHNFKEKAAQKEDEIYNAYKDDPIPHWCLDLDERQKKAHPHRTSGGLELSTHAEVRDDQKGELANIKGERRICKRFKALRTGQQ